MKDWFADHTNPHGIKGSLQEALEGADLYLGLSGPGTIEAPFLAKWLAIQLYLQWPIQRQQVMPEDAAPYVRIMATGRSDYPNQLITYFVFRVFSEAPLIARRQTQ